MEDLRYVKIWRDSGRFIGKAFRDFWVEHSSGDLQLSFGSFTLKLCVHLPVAHAAKLLG